MKGALTVGSGAALTSIAAVILTEGGGPFQLLGMMLFCSLVALLAALDVRRVSKRKRSEFSQVPVN